jgi:MFS family permease
MQATATVIGIVTGVGELLGYSLRLVSGRLADATGRLWPITVFGYLVQMLSVPALALAHTWTVAAAFIILERIGKAIRNPPRDVLLSHAAEEIGGYGWTFGLHEALDQFGAMVGPLLVAAVLAHTGDYRTAFAVLLVPALINLSLVGLARWLYPRPENFGDGADQSMATGDIPKVYWLYLVAAALAAAGFADYPIIAYHFDRSAVVPGVWIAVFYAVAMGVSGTGSLVFGRLYDRFGFPVLIILTLISALFAPLVFLGTFWPALIGAALWGLGMGVHESIIPAAVAPMVPTARRAYAFGLFTAGYGIAWFLGSAVIGILYDESIFAAVVFCVAIELAAVPVLFVVALRYRLAHGNP